MFQFNTYSTNIDSLNTASYLTSLEWKNFYKNTEPNTTFGDSNKDIIELSLFNVNNEQTAWIPITQSSVLYQTETYDYIDIDNNKFTDSYKYTTNKLIKDPTGNFLFSPSYVFDSYGITSNIINTSINMLRHVVGTYEYPLIVKQISNSRKELKLIPKFRKISTTKNYTVKYQDEKILIDGQSEISFEKGILYTLIVDPSIFSNIKFNKVLDGGFFGVDDYSIGIIYQKDKNVILIDTTEDLFPDVLYFYNNIKQNQGGKILFTAKSFSDEELEQNIRYSAFINKQPIIKDIFDKVSNILNSPNFASTLSYIKNENTAADELIRKNYGIKDDAELLNLITVIYNGELLNVGTSLQQQFYGIKLYFENYLKLNYEFSTSFLSLENEFGIITKSSIRKKLNSIITVPPDVFAVCSDYLYKFYTTYFFKVYMSEFSSNYNAQFFDYLKNSLNLGGNNLVSILNYTYESANSNTDHDVLYIKLKDALDNSVVVGSSVFISNTSIAPILQKIYYLTDSQKSSFKIKGPNFTVNLADRNKIIKTNDSSVLYNYSDLKASSVDDTNDTLNNKIGINKKINAIGVDYSSFENFIVFSSAETRIKVFQNKIIELSNNQSLYNSYPTNSVDSGRDLLKQKINDTIATFDGYESYLYNSGNYAYDVSTSTFISSSYIDSQLVEAREFDIDNRDSLVNNTPEYILLDDNNSDYLLFLSMVGHMFDNLYLYIRYTPKLSDHMTDFTSTAQGMMLQVMLDSFGFKVPPNANGNIENKDMVTNYLNVYDLDDVVCDLSLNELSFEDKSKLIWRRILKTLPLIYKTKGTEECIRVLLACYGVPRNMLNIREYGGGYFDSDISSSLVVYENVYMLKFDGTDDQYLNIPVPNGFRSIDFKVYFDPSTCQFGNYCALIKKYNEIYEYGWEFGIVKQPLSDASRFYFFIVNKSTKTPLIYFSNPVGIFNDGIFNVLIRQLDASSKFGPTSGVDGVPREYEIVVNYTDSGVSFINEKMNFILSEDYNNAFNKDIQTLGHLIVGNFNPSGVNYISPDEFTEAYLIDEAGENYLISEGNDFLDKNLIKEKLNSLLINPIQPTNFIGCIDKINIWNTALSDIDFETRCKNHSSYSNSSPSTTNEDLFFRMNYTSPVNLYSSSVSIIGYPIENRSKSYSTITGAAFNFTASHYTTIQNTASCEYTTTYTFPYQFKEFGINSILDTSFVGPNRLENKKIDQYTETIEFNQLSSATSNAIKPNSLYDTNKLGLFLSPIEERNRDIIDYFGKYNIIQSISDVDSIFSKKYLALDKLRQDFIKSSPHKILFNELFSIYKAYFDQSFFETVKSLVPARNKIFTGILIEPTILERTKLYNTPNIEEIIQLDANIPNSKVIVLNEGLFIETKSGSFSVPFSKTSQQAFVENCGLYKDVTDDYQNEIFADNMTVPTSSTPYTSVNSVVEYRGETYYGYLVDFYKSFLYDQDKYNTQTNTTYDTLYTKVILVNTASLKDIRNIGNFTNLRPLQKISNNLLFKNNPLRKKSIKTDMVGTYYKSRETNKTAIRDPNNNNVNQSYEPIIVVKVGNNVARVNTGKIVTTSI